VAEALAFLQAAFPTTIAGGGLFGIYIYFRKVDAAIKEDLRKTIASQAEEIARLWKECRELRAELKTRDEPEADGGSK
jgi:hypothetical protein